jgi:DNA-binding winged helix-turn-helix (wHTH) protein
MLLIRFGEFVLDERRYALEGAAGAVPLRPKAFDLLLHLARHRDRVVMREELVQVVWGETRVGAGSLAGLVNEVRQALGERGREASAIRTVHGRGYQFVAATTGSESGRRLPEGAAHSLEGVEAANLDRAIQAAIGRVSASGAMGLVAETGVAIAAAKVESCCRVSGFDLIRRSAPVESMATRGRLAGDLLAGLIAARSRDEVGAALPLPARLWLESPPRASVAGGHRVPMTGLPGGLSAVAAAYGRCAARKPVLLHLSGVGRAGAEYVQDLHRFMRAVERAPILVFVTLEESDDERARSRLLNVEGGFFKRLPGVPEPDTPGLESVPQALERWCRDRSIDVLPLEVEAALLAHLRGDVPLERLRQDQVVGTSAGADVERTREGAAARKTEGDVPGEPPRPRLRRVEPIQESARGLDGVRGR